MATKKPAPKKVAPAKKAAAKPAPKKAAPAKKAAAKPAVKPAKGKAAPAKKAAAKPIPKPAPKKAAPAKKAAKPAPKAVPAKGKAPVKPAAKPAPKPAPKPVAKKTVPVKPAAKPMVKPAPVAAKPVPAKPAAPPAPPAKPKVEVKAPPAPPVKPVKKQPEPIKDVKVPKINTKTSVPYRPGYTQLEKRADAARSNGDPLIKYSDNDLNEFRELISKKLEAAKKELAYLQGLITRKDEMGGDNDDARYMTMEDGSMSMEREQLSQMASRQITYIDHLEKATMRIENKTYGICRVTGKLIDKARLRAVPHATLSLEAKLGLVKPTAEQ
ncbi:MAG: Transcriptional regulator, TraR/DksA family [Sediminibacterium sp.]|nr:Transcriptional regulator, TraR/DksA family [Sediminibacterium sp.]